MQITFYVQGRIAERVNLAPVPRVGDSVWLQDGYFIVQRVTYDFRRENKHVVHIWIAKDEEQ